MPRAATNTQLSIDRWAEILGINPLHFSGVTTTILPLTTCGNIWFQHAWQNTNQVGRDDIAQAISQAEETIERELGYRLLPSWESDERVIAPQPGIPEVINVGFLDPRGFRPSTRLAYGHFISGGIEARTLLQADVPVFYQDNDLDGYEETARIDVTTAGVTDVEDVAIYFAASSVGQPALSEWEIKPLRTITISGGVVTVTMWKHQLVRPELWEGLGAVGVNGDDQDNFAPSVDLYRRWNDPQQQTTLLWRPRPTVCDCGGSGCAACAFQVQTACLHPLDPRLGIISYQSAQWDATDEEFDVLTPAVGRTPDQLRAWYYAGNRDMRRTWPRRQMEPTLERAVVYYSLGILDRPLCGCHNLEATWRHWAEDLTIRASDGVTSRSFQIDKKVKDNPFGATRGAIFAWNAVQADGRRVGRAVAI